MRYDTRSSIRGRPACITSDRVPRRSRLATIFEGAAFGAVRRFRKRFFTFAIFCFFLFLFVEYKVWQLKFLDMEVSSFEINIWKHIDFLYENTNF